MLTLHCKTGKRQANTIPYTLKLPQEIALGLNISAYNEVFFRADVLELVMYLAAAALIEPSWHCSEEVRWGRGVKWPGM